MKVVATQQSVTFQMSDDRLNRLTKIHKLFQLLIAVGGADMAHGFLANFVAAADRLDGPHKGTVAIRIEILAYEHDPKQYHRQMRMSGYMY